MEDIEARHRAFYDAEVGVRARRPLGPERERAVATFVTLLREHGLRSVLEVGSGPGRDAAFLLQGGLAYTGLDLSPGAVAHTRSLGLDTRVGSVLELPFADGEFDALWSMSTLMHLPDDGMAVALAEVRRVVRPGGLVGIGVWGSTRAGPWRDAHGRFFLHRTDEELLRELAVLGDVGTLETWGHLEDGGHYQLALVRVGGAPP